MTTNYLYRMYNAAWIVLPLKEIDFIYKNIYQSIWKSRKKSNKNSVTNLDISWPHAFCIQFGRLLLFVVSFHFLLSNMHTHSGVWMTGLTYNMYYDGGYSCHTMRTESTVCNKLIRFVSRLTTSIPHCFPSLSVQAIYLVQFWWLLCMKKGRERMRAKKTEQTNAKNFRIDKQRRSSLLYSLSVNWTMAISNFRWCTTFSNGTE